MGAMTVATSDDLLSLLSIYRDCTELRREKYAELAQEQQQQQKQPAPINVINDWAHVVTHLPMQRNNVDHVLSTVSGAIEHYYNSTSSSNISSVSIDPSRDTSFASILEQVETAAANLRATMQTYSTSIPSFKRAMCNLWNAKPLTCESSDILSYVGSLLSSQLIDQLEWDEGLMDEALRLLGNMYSDSKTEMSTIKIYAKAFSAMLRIDKPLWKIVGIQALDELKLMEDDGASTTATLDKTGSSSSLEIHPHLDDSHQLEQKWSRVRSLHELIMSSDSIEEAVKTFASETHINSISNQQYHHATITSMLIIGEEGCGKSFLLDSIHQYTDQSNKSPMIVMRPTHQDFAGITVGSSEDRWISLFSYAESEIRVGTKVLILLDDIDILLSLNDLGGVSSTRFQVGRRCKSLFLSIFDSLQASSRSTLGHMMIICTARSKCDEIAGRMDRIFNLSQIGDERRRQLIVKCLSTGTNEAPAEFDKSYLSLVIKHSAGRSAFELSQCCRDVIVSEALSGGDGDIVNASSLFDGRLRRLDKMMQTKAPQSLRGGSLDGVVDMIVITPEELISRLETNGCEEAALPLLGTDAKRAYESLMNVVVTPLCRSDKITRLLYGGASRNQGAANDQHTSKPIRVGALLAGGPGVGKTSLAYHCASVAARMSRVTLLDVSCTSLIHKEIGGSERAVHHLFEAVRAAAPCLLLLDGIENVAPRRGNDCTTEGTMDRVLSTFLTEMDGISDGAAANVGVIGITYGPDLIDPSLLRPGRLEKTIKLGTPDFEARKELVSQNIDDLNFDFSSAGFFDPKNIDDISQYVAMESSGMSAVETIAICKEAAMECLRELDFVVTGSPLLSHRHFKAAVNVMKGKKAN